MIRLTNSAIIIRPGIYSAKSISKDDFISIIRNTPDCEITSSIGYKHNLYLIEKWTGKRFPISREYTEIQDGDKILAMRLKYRLENPIMKGYYVPEEDDFEFFIIDYKEKL